MSSNLHRMVLQDLQLKEDLIYNDHMNGEQKRLEALSIEGQSYLEEFGFADKADQPIPSRPDIKGRDFLHIPECQKSAGDLLRTYVENKNDPRYKDLYQPLRQHMAKFLGIDLQENS